MAQRLVKLVVLGRHTRQRGRAGLRRVSVAALIMLVVQYGLGIVLNLYVPVPASDQHAGFIQEIATAPPALTVHALLGLALIGTAIMLLARAVIVRDRLLAGLASAGLTAIGGAFAAGEIFVGNGQPGASLAMGILTGVALLCYVGTLALASAAQRQVIRPPSHPAVALPAKSPGSWLVRGVKQDPAGLRPGAAAGPGGDRVEIQGRTGEAAEGYDLIADSTVAWGVHWVRYPERARGHANNPVMAQFWGAPPMALMTLGTGSAG